MVIGAMKIRIYIPWAHSLKEKRMVVKSICKKLQNKFHISVAEVEEQDLHQVIVIGLSCIASGTAHADSIMDHMIDFIDGNTEGSITDIKREIVFVL